MPDIGASATAGIGGGKVSAGLDLKLTIGLLSALGLLAVIAYHAATQLRPNADLNAPPKQPADERDTGMATVLATLNPLDGSERHSHVAEPRHHYQGYVYLPCRYPRTVGGEITNAIHHGYSSMRLPMAGDISEWIAAAPSEVAW